MTPETAGGRQYYHRPRSRLWSTLFSELDGGGNLPVRIFVYGVPGSGKTSFTRLLAGSLGYPLIEADSLRGQSKESGAFERIGTTDAWKHFGDLSAESVYAGLLAVRA